MDYLWLKALHIIAVITWVGGMLVAGVTVSAAATDTARPSVAFVAAVRLWDRRLTTSAMLAVWALGLSLAYAGSWFQQGWLGAKFALVLALSAIHGMVSGRLRRLGGEKPADVGFAAHAPIVIVAIVSVVVILVVTKPF